MVLYLTSLRGLSNFPGGLYSNSASLKPYRQICSQKKGGWFSCSARQFTCRAVNFAVNLPSSFPTSILFLSTKNSSLTAFFCGLRVRYEYWIAFDFLSIASLVMKLYFSSENNITTKQDDLFVLLSRTGLDMPTGIFDWALPIDNVVLIILDELREGGSFLGRILVTSSHHFLYLL